MSIPDYQTVMLPLLEHLGDKEEKATRETLDALASKFNLTEEEKKELLPSGQQPIFSNRVGWAKVYLKKAGLIESTRRGYYKITQKGLNILSEKPSKIDNEYLKQFSEFLDFTKGRSEKGEMRGKISNYVISQMKRHRKNTSNLDIKRFIRIYLRTFLIE